MGERIRDMKVYGSRARREGIAGEIKCTLEMEGPKKAIKLLKKAEKQFPDSNRFVDVRSDILQRLK